MVLQAENICFHFDIVLMTGSYQRQAVWITFHFCCLRQPKHFVELSEWWLTNWSLSKGSGANIWFKWEGFVLTFHLQLFGMQKTLCVCVCVWGGGGQYLWIGISVCMCVCVCVCVSVCVFERERERGCMLFVYIYNGLNIDVTRLTACKT